MDVLDNYKKAWENQPEEKQVSAIEIYKMAHSKSSSIVKWIFIIGILEFIFWTAINFIIPKDFYQIYEELNMMTFLQIFGVLHYIIIVAFLYIFYKNYTNISLIDSTKKLIKNILRIRKTVQYYVYYNIAMVFFGSIILNVVLFSDSERFQRLMNPNNIEIEANQLIIVTIISQVIALIIITVLLWLFYRVVYGILLKRLNKNYKELLKIEDQ